MIYFIYIGWADFWGSKFSISILCWFFNKNIFMKIGKHEHYTRPLSLITPVCACVRVCVCVRERERERERDP